MTEPLRILILEDDHADAELIQFELEEAGFTYTSKVVTTEKAFIHETQEFSPDLILSDYDLPTYSGALALAEAKRRCPDTPFILVTGAVTEDRADPKTLWHTYIQLTEVEDAFRTTKHDLGMRPVYHQKKDRVQAHILVCFLSLAMWRTLQQWMKASGLGTAPRKLLEEMKEIKSLDVLLPTRDKQLRLRVVSTAPKELKMLLQRMKVLLPSRPKIIENVVQKIA
jgi:CheY-like chemotaxis protein